MKAVKSYDTSTKEDKSSSKEHTSFLVDLMALIQTVSPVPDT